MGSPLLKMRKPKLRALKLKNTPRQGATEPGLALRAREGRTWTQGSGFHRKESLRWACQARMEGPEGRVPEFIPAYPSQSCSFSADKGTHLKDQIL